MRKMMILVAALFVFVSCDVRKKDKLAVNQPLTQQVEIKDPTTVQMIDSVYDFGKVMDGEMVEFSYRFKNSGTKPLIVTSAVASCGCTVPEKPEAPIKPGETGYIKVKFDSKGRVGNTHKTVTVTSNAQPGFPEILLTGEVTPKKEN